MGQENLGRNFFGVNKNVGRKFFRVKKMSVGNSFGSTKFGSDICLAKLYFGLIRFVCVILLFTAELNNNNTEFVCGGWVTHP